MFIRPIRFRLGTFDLTTKALLLSKVKSLAKALRNSSALLSSRAILDVPNIYSRIFYKHKGIIELTNGHLR